MNSQEWTLSRSVPELKVVSSADSPLTLSYQFKCNRGGSKGGDWGRGVMFFPFPGSSRQQEAEELAGLSPGT